MGNQLDLLLLILLMDYHLHHKPLEYIINSDYSETETTLYLTNTNQSETIVPDIHFLWDCEEGPFSVSNDSGIVYVCDEIMTVPQTVEGAYIEIDWSPGNADACSSTGMRFKFGGTTYYLTECGDPCRLEVGDELTSDQSGSAYFVQSCGGGMNYQYYVSSIIFGVE